MKSVLDAVCVAVLLAECACTTSAGNPTTPPGNTDSGAPDGRGAISIDADGGAVVNIELAPLTLRPTFSPSISDYYVACGAGGTQVTLTITDEGGSRSTPVHLQEDGAVVVAGQYWIRCLAHDFPAITVTTHPDAGSPTPGLYLVNSTAFVAVFDTNGTPVWYERGAGVLNLDAPAANTLSYMIGSTAPFGFSVQSQFVVHALDSGSKTDITAVNGPTDGHELQSLPSGNHLLFTYPLESGFDLTGLEKLGPGETIADCMIQEVDPTGAMVWSWLATDHVDPVKESVEPATQMVGGKPVVDVFHCNAIDADSSGNLLVSMRHANAVLYVERSTGKVLWKLNGTSYNKDGAAHVEIDGDPQTQFTMQHDARFRPNGNVSLFDDHGAGTGVARAVEYAIDHTRGTATVAWQFLGTAASQYEGSVRRYADGETVIGWGYVPTDPRILTEVDADGHDVLDIAFAGTNPSYRAVKVPLSQLNLDVLRRTAAVP